ncbi:MAG: hypothetical protein U1F33_10225 [Alphaproteobacteria bacterium]
MLIDAGRSLLLNVDVEKQLLPSVREPAGLGPAMAALAGRAPVDAVPAKLPVSSAADPILSRRIDASGRSQFVIAGNETHG